MKESESNGNYLKAIHELENHQGHVRSVDIAKWLGISKASVCVAMKKLCQEDLAKMDGDKKIHLTASGRNLALDIENKYLIVKRLLISVMNVDENTATQDAGRIKHHISNESISKIEAKLDG